VHRQLKWIAPVALAASTLHPWQLAAQVSPALEVGSGVGQPVTNAWVRESRVAPGIQLTGARGSFSFGSELSERAGRVSLLRAGIDGRIMSDAFAGGRLRFSVEGSVASDSASRMVMVGVPKSTATAALSARMGRGGAWFGSTAQSGSHTAAALGLWRTFNRVVLSVSSTSLPRAVSGVRYSNVLSGVWDSIPSDTGVIRIWRDTTIVQAVSTVSRRMMSQVQMRADLALSRFLMSAIVDVRPRLDSMPSNVWVRVSATTLLNPRVAVFATAGASQHVAYEPGPLADLNATSVRTQPQHFATFGVRLSRGHRVHQPLPAAIRPSASSLTIVRDGEALYKVTLRVQGARTVEISGDFCDWRPLSLHETDANTWEVTIPITAGTHRLNVRVDGDAWTAPAGVATVDDEFNGRVGIVVVP
jgi:hypothetical protein